MEKTINGIIFKHVHNELSSAPCFDAAIAVTTHIEANYYEKEFVEWLETNCDFRFPDLDTNDNLLYEPISDALFKKDLTLSEVHDYWLTEIKDK